jgi:lysophospholipase L1-like esterase
MVGYVAEVRRLGAEKNIPVIDLYALTLAQAEALPVGERESLNATKDGKTDTTHLGPKGRHEIGAMCAREFVRIVPSMKAYLTR